MKSIFALFLILGVFISSAFGSTTPHVSAMYLIPSDKTFNPKYVAGIEHALKALRLWYWHQMMINQNQGLTFEIDPGPVLVRQTSKPSAE